jgi:hypothetical protein
VRQRYAREVIRGLDRGALVWTVVAGFVVFVVVAVGSVLVLASRGGPSPPAGPAPGADVILVQGKVNFAGGPYWDTERTWALADGTAERTQTSRDGRVVQDHSTRPDSSVVDVDHETRTYLTLPPADCADPAKCGGPPFPSPYSADAVAEAMKGGHLTAADEGEVLDGHPVLHLRGDYLDLSLAGTVDLWVDATTCRPIRYVVSGASTLREGTITYLPGTPENLAQLTTPIPPGYTQR